MSTPSPTSRPWYSRRIDALLNRVDAEAEKLSGFRRAEAAALALTTSEMEELAFLRDYEDHEALHEAAPDLLAALESAFVAFGKAGGNTLTGPFRKEWEECRAAIAKAKGGA